MKKKEIRKEIQEEIENIAQQGATDGCNMPYIERESKKLAKKIVKMFTSENSNEIINKPLPPEPPRSIVLKEGENPRRPKNR